MEGVIRTRLGYAGGKTANPTYRRIGDHMETIQVDYDPAKVSYSELLDIFLKEHDPSWKAPIRQYASAVFYHDTGQKKEATRALNGWMEKRGRIPVTEIAEFTSFTLAEDYHQKYRLKNTRALMKEYEAYYPDPADQVNSTALARVNGYLGGVGTLTQLEKELPYLGLSESGRAMLYEYVKKYNPVN
jgi:methionine-S-sulfoxide reductase